MCWKDPSHTGKRAAEGTAKHGEVGEVVSGHVGVSVSLHLAKPAEDQQYGMNRMKKRCFADSLQTLPHSLSLKSLLCIGS